MQHLGICQLGRRQLVIYVLSLHKVFIFCKYKAKKSIFFKWHGKRAWVRALTLKKITYFEALFKLFQD